MKKIYQSERHFILFDFLVSHGQILFRSQKDDGKVKNIDIIFFDTSFIQSFTRLNGISIKMKEEKDCLIKYELVNKYLSSKDNFLFEVESGGEKYYIAASFFKVFENDLDFVESSLGFSGKGREVEIASSL